MRNRFASRAPVADRRPIAFNKALQRTKKVAWIVATIAMFLFWAQLVRPDSLGGNAGYVLVSGQSMEPRYHTGDMVMVLHRSGYHTGDVIAYRVPKGDAMAGAHVIHRIIGGNAKKGFVVQGDNRSAPDVWHPKQGDIVGSQVLRIPNAVAVLQWLRSPLLLALLAASFVFVRMIGRNKKETPADDTLADGAGLDGSA
jgi:signal peptidase I